MILNGSNLESEIDSSRQKNHIMDYVSNLERIQKSLILNHKHNKLHHFLNLKKTGHLEM